MDSLTRQGMATQIVRNVVNEARDEKRPPVERETLASIAGQYAWALYHDIEASTGKSPVSPAMEARRGVPSDPGYFEELDAIDEFLDVLGARGAASDKSG